MNKCIDLVVAETPLVKKKHRRARSGARHFDGNVPDGGALCVLFHMEMHCEYSPIVIVQTSL